METLVLGSNSPRRKDLLSSCDIKFEVISHKFDETSIKYKNPVVYAENLSLKKAESLKEMTETSGKYILGVDTIVVFNNKILGKPGNIQEAESYVRMLSGRSNRVISGISLINSSKNVSITSHSISTVYFHKFNEDFIKLYLDNNHWEGYAGGYAIQGIFSLVTKKITGSYTNIVGLPMEILYGMLTKLNIYP